MDLIGFVTAPLRSLLGAVERETERELPIKGLTQIEGRMLDTEMAIRATTESIARHVEVLETLSESLPHLTLAVEQLTEQVSGISGVLSPVAGAERRVAGIERLFGRSTPHDGPPPDATAPAPPRPAGHA